MAAVITFGGFVYGIGGAVLFASWLWLLYHDHDWCLHAAPLPETAYPEGAVAVPVNCECPCRRCDRTCR